MNSTNYQFSLNEVVQALNELYFGTSPDKKATANEYLVKFQESPLSSNIAQTLLQNENITLALFGAQTLYKIISRQEELQPQQCFEQLIILLTPISTGSVKDRRILIQLGLSAAHLLLLGTVKQLATFIDSVVTNNPKVATGSALISLAITPNGTLSNSRDFENIPATFVLDLLTEIITRKDSDIVCPSNKSSISSCLSERFGQKILGYAIVYLNSADEVQVKAALKLISVCSKNLRLSIFENQSMENTIR